MLHCSAPAAAERRTERENTGPDNDGLYLKENTDSGIRRTGDTHRDDGKSRFIATIDGEPLTRLRTDDVTNDNLRTT